MPFTVVHTLAVIPLYKYLGKIGAFSALIIGSMTPDFAYLTPVLVHQRVDSHSFLGLYLYCIPMGLTIYFLYHWLMAPVLVSLLPKPLQNMLNKDLFEGTLPNIPSYLLIFSLLLGAFTHITWDFFTHSSGLPQYLSWMNIPLSNIDGYNIMPYRVLQHLSSFLGMFLLIFLIWQWYKKNLRSGSSKPTATQNTPNRSWQASKVLRTFSLYFLLIASITIGIIVGIINMPNSNVMYGIYDAQVFIRYFIVGSAGAFIITSALLGLLYQYKIRTR